MRKRGILRLAALLLALIMLLGGCAQVTDSLRELLGGDERQSNRSDRDDDEGDEDDEDDDEASRTPQYTPAEVCRQFFAAYSSRDGDTVGSLLTGTGVPYSFGSVTGLLAQRVKAEIGLPETDSDSCTVPVTIENVDFGAVVRQISAEIDSEEDANAWMAEAFSGEDVPMTSFEIQVLLRLENGEWKIQMTNDLADALLGGYYSALAEMSGETTQ